MHNCDTSGTEYYECDLTPITDGVANLPSTQRNKIKLAGNIGTGDALCLLYSYCRDTEEGFYLLCREPPKFLLRLLLQVIELLTTLLNGIIGVPTLKLVSQSGCIFTNTCPP